MVTKKRRGISVRICWDPAGQNKVAGFLKVGISPDSLTLGFLVTKMSQSPTARFPQSGCKRRPQTSADAQLEKIAVLRIIRQRPPDG